MRSEKTSYSCLLGSNKKRKLAAATMMSRQAAGEIPDMLVFYNRYELGAAEVSKVETDNTKEKNDASLKLLKIMKSMLVNLVKSASHERHNLKIVGMFLSGMKISFFELSNPTGQVCVVEKINEFYFPIHSKELMKRMTPLVQQVWINKLEMESRLENVLLSEPLPSSEAEASLIPCFIRMK